MGRRVQTGCPNCKRCTNSAVGEGGRKAGRAMVAMMTGGISEGARLATKNCRACGHKMSLHAQVSASPEAPRSLPRNVEIAQNLVHRFRAKTDPEQVSTPEVLASTEPNQPSTMASDDLTEQLAKLGELKASGLLSDEEFAAAKARLLG